MLLNEILKRLMSALETCQSELVQYSTGMVDGIGGVSSMFQNTNKAEVLNRLTNDTEQCRKSLADYLTQCRTKTGISQREAGRRGQISQVPVSKLEGAINDTTLTTFIKVCIGSGADPHTALDVFMGIYQDTEGPKTGD